MKDAIGDSQYHLFCLERDAEIERWEGGRFGTDRAVSEFGADEVRSEEERMLAKSCEGS